MPDWLEPPFDDGRDRPFPLPPDDRLWRHPSEMGRVGASSEPARSTSATTTGRRVGPRTAMVLAGLGLGLFAVGTLVVAGWVTAERNESDAATGRVHDVVYLASSTTVEVSRAGWLGISAVEEGGVSGVTVTDCDAGSPAEIALRPGDVIESVDSTPTPTMAELITVLAATRPGHLAQIRVVRDEHSMVVPVVLGRQP